MGIIEKTAFYYKKGKIDGTTKAFKDRAKTKDEKSNHFKIYEKILDNAWADGKLTEDEKAMVNVLNHELGINKKKFFELSNSKRIEIYKNVLEQAWDDGVITTDEQDILDNLMEELGISMEMHAKLTKEIRIKKKKELEEKKKNERKFKCPSCATVFKSIPKEGIVRCPSCNKKFRFVK